MIKKSILSVLGGIVLALTLSMGTNVRAQEADCASFGCPDRIGCYYASGRIVYWVWGCGGGCIIITEVQCQYAGGPCGVDPNIAE